MTDHFTSRFRDRWGLARRSDLLFAGATDGEIDSAWRRGAVVRVRHGLYALPGADPEVVRAVRVGGVLAGPGASERHGLWVPPDPALTVSVMPNAHRLRDPDDAGKPLEPGRADLVLLRDRHRLDPDAERFVVSAETAVVQAVRLLPPAQALAVIDSALRLPLHRRPDLESVGARLSLRGRCLVQWQDPAAESGTESAFRHGLLVAGLDFEPQVWLTDDIRVDFVVAGFVVVECQSREHHSSPDTYNRDRERISTIVRLGYVVLEFTYAQVMFDWEGVWAAVLAALRLAGSARPRPFLRIRE